MGDVKLPDFGPMVEDATITKWTKRLGDKVEKGDLLLEVDIDKANMEIESTETGVLQEIRVKEGETAVSGAVIGVIG